MATADNAVRLARARVEADEQSFAKVDAERQFLVKELEKLSKARAEVDGRAGIAKAKLEGLTRRLQELEEQDGKFVADMVAAERDAQRMHAEAAELTAQLEVQRALAARTEEALAQKQVAVDMATRKLRAAGKPLPGAEQGGADANDQLRQQLAEATGRAKGLETALKEATQQLEGIEGEVAAARRRAAEAAAVAGVSEAETRDILGELEAANQAEADHRRRLADARETLLLRQDELEHLDRVADELRKVGIVPRSMAEMRVMVDEGEQRRTAALAQATAAAMAAQAPPPPAPARKVRTATVGTQADIVVQRQRADSATTVATEATIVHDPPVADDGAGAGAGAGGSVDGDGASAGAGLQDDLEGNGTGEGDGEGPQPRVEEEEVPAQVVPEDHGAAQRSVPARATNESIVVDGQVPPSDSMDNMNAALAQVQSEQPIAVDDATETKRPEHDPALVMLRGGGA